MSDLQRRRRLVVIGGALDPSARLIAKLKAVGTPTISPALFYVSATANRIYVPAYGSDPSCFIGYQIDKTATNMWCLGSANPWSILGNGHDRADAGLTYSGTWSAFSGASCFNGISTYSQTQNDYVEWTVTGARCLWIVTTNYTYSGIGAITINGATTLCDKLPASGSLLAGEFDTYGATTQNNRVWVSSTLDPIQTYTVRITIPHKKRVASTGYRVCFEGWGTELSTDWSNYLVLTNVKKQLESTGVTGNAWEVAISYQPPTATAVEWTGSQHGNEVVKDPITWKDGAGADISVSVGVPYKIANQIVVTQTAYARHSETGITNHAIVTYIHTALPSGLNIYHRHDWLDACVINTAYPAMACYADAVNRGFVAGDITLYNLGLGDGVQHGQLRALASCLFVSGDDKVFWLSVRSATSLNSWLTDNAYHYIQDRVGNALNKDYVQRVGGTTVIVGNGDIWDAITDYGMSVYAAPDTRIP